MNAMMWGAGLMCALVTIALILATSALVKYLLFNNQGGKYEDR